MRKGKHCKDNLWLANVFSLLLHVHLHCDTSRACLCGTTLTNRLVVTGDDFVMTNTLLIIKLAEETDMTNVRLLHVKYTLLQIWFLCFFSIVYYILLLLISAWCFFLYVTKSILLTLSSSIQNGDFFYKKMGTFNCGWCTTQKHIIKLLLCSRHMHELAMSKQNNCHLNT